MAVFEETIMSLPTVALRGLVMFPNVTLHFDVGRKQSIAAVKAAMLAKQDIFLVAQKNMSDEIDPQKSLYKMGVVGEIKQLVRIPSTDYIRVIVEGKYRAELVEIENAQPYLDAKIRKVDTKKVRASMSLDEEALLRHLKDLFDFYASVAPKLAPDVPAGVFDCDRVGKLSDYIAANIPLQSKDKQTILEELSPLKRAKLLSVILTKEIELLNLEADITERVQEQIDENQKEYYLREQLKAIGAELGDAESPQSDSEKYREKIIALRLPKDSEEKLLKECDHLKYMQISSPESTVIRNYLDKVLELPWNIYTKDMLDIDKARKTLNKEHYGLKEVKERIIELIAVRKLSPDIKGQIVCLVGPPGVGKTSIARSLAKAMNRRYARVSLGGVHDEAEIRGHRKTYIGAMPGNIIDAVIQAKSSNPLILLDEIDKLASDYKGDPSSALLEALDPEQNNTFRDHYVEVPFDLSKVLFITTANDRSQIPAPLLDRMDIIELYSYTHEEKFQIAKKHLIPKQLKENGMRASMLHFTDGAIHDVISGYTREAGVRTLERTFSKIMRKEAVNFASGEKQKVTVKPAMLESLLGPKKYKTETVDKENAIGVVNGLAWTSVGGELLKVEAVKMHGTGKVELTGSLGDVMKESAKTAFSYVRSISDKLPIDIEFYKNTDVHIHFPEGAVPKDGPSAGIAITTAIVSALTLCPVRFDIAMTGEVTLTGKVLPIGGLKEKTMAAYKSGVKLVFIPEENLPDLQQIDETVKANVLFVPVSDVKEVLKQAIVSSNVANPKASAINVQAAQNTASAVCRQN